MSPLSLPHLGLLGLVLIMLVAMIEVGIIESAYYKLGMSHRAITLLLLLSILGSYVNIPVATLHYHAHQHVYNLSYIPAYEMVLRPGETIIAINLGGAVIPILLSAYLMLRIGGILPAIVATAIVTFIVHHFSRIVPGAGITVPTFIPGIAAAVLAMILTREHRPVVAYVAGTIGCLLGADILNLGLVARLHAAVASIGGAGTFDGVFISGIIAVLLS
jgi:uncharacterized membrane protein